jgi:hypothetical protein
MIEIFIVALVILLIVQAVTFIKIMRIVRQVNKLLLEVRILFKNSGIYYHPQQNKLIKSNTCQYCRYRLSFIQITEESEKDNFYYKCKKHDKAISLVDTCQQFERDFHPM